MDEQLKEVDFKTYCNKCKYKDTPETKDPCNKCLTHGSMPYSHKPLNFEEKKND